MVQGQGQTGKTYKDWNSLGKRLKHRHSTLDRHEYGVWLKAFTCRPVNQASSIKHYTARFFANMISFGADLKSSDECLTALTFRAGWNTFKNTLFMPYMNDWRQACETRVGHTAPTRLQVMQHSLNFYTLPDRNRYRRAYNQNYLSYTRV